MNRIILVLLALYINGHTQEEEIIYLIPSVDAFLQTIGGPNEAYSTGAGDLFINPALISRYDNSEIQFSNLINGYSLKYLSTALVTKFSEKSYLGLGVFGINIPISEIYDGAEYNLRYQDNYQVNLNISYAYKFPLFTLGGSFKYGYYRFDLNGYENKTQNREAIVGLFKELLKNVNFGMSYSQAIYSNKNKNYKDPFGSRLGMGMAWDAFTRPAKEFTVLVSLDNVENHGFNFNYGFIARILNREQPGNIGIKSFSIKYGIGNYNTASFKLPGHKVRFLEEENRDKIGIGVEFSSIYNLELGFNFCFTYDKILQNMNLITTRLKL